MPTLSADDLKDEKKISAFISALQAQLTTDQNGTRYEVSWGSSPGHEEVLITRSEHGSITISRVDSEFLSSGEYRSLRALGGLLEDLLQPGASIRRGEKSQTVASFEEAHAWLMEEARRGQTIQRYKGLGEMNPEQLWETTMEPSTRRLLKVNIEDGVAADEVFTTLMGDQVEPRREFIEKNALAVTNLDI